MALVAQTPAAPAQATSVLALDVATLHKELAALSERGQTDHIISLLEASPEAADAIMAGLNADGSTGLHFAAWGGHLKLMQELVSRKCNVDCRDARQQTPLHIACAEGFPEMSWELLLAGAAPNAIDDTRQTPLHKAVMAGAGPDMLQVLLQQGSDPSLPDTTGTPPLLLAASRGRIDQISCLLAHDSSLIHGCNECGWTSLHLAAHGRETKTSSLKPAKFPAAVKLLLEAKAEPNRADEDKKTALHRAAASGNLATTKALLDGEADIMASDTCRWMPLHFACQDGHLEVAKLLLESKALVQRANPECLTPLAVATMENQVKIAELLMKHGADPNLRGKGLASPIAIARKEPNKYADILSLFELGFVHH